MKSTTFSVVFALVIAVASADAIPACIETCGVKYIGSTGCDLTDIKCICSNEAFTQKVSLCIDAECSEADQMHAESICNPTMSTMPNMSVTMVSSSSVVVHITTIHASGYNSTATATTMGAGNSTKLSTAATIITGNLTKTSNTHPSTTDASTDTSETESSTTDASSSDASETSGLAAATSSTGGAARVVGSGFFAAVMGMGFFFL